MIGERGGDGEGGGGGGGGEVSVSKEDGTDARWRPSLAPEGNWSAGETERESEQEQEQADSPVDSSRLLVLA